METALIALLLASLAPGAWCAVTRQARSLRFLPVVSATIVLSCFLLMTSYMSAGEAKVPAKAKPQVEPVRKKLVAPKNWPDGHPLPIVGSNCAACHLTAGRELTAAVTNFVRSVHDINEMTCYDCHGGNSRDDVKAHEGEFGFIGTKKSAHIQGCSECHSEEAELLASGPHHWDFTTRINTEYPLCFDCHGNHDIGNPPADFKLAAMCGDCHDKPQKDFPNIAAVVNENDKLWGTLRKVHKKNIANTENPVPPRFRKDVDSLRTDTMQIIHSAMEISSATASSLNGRAEKLRLGLENWLQSTK
ncbi:MAG: cytochrome c3 family protein [Planctomycetia bacterium]|nr:cytochrome c3 family protein [Planctomycetia bacterium]